MSDAADRKLSETLPGSWRLVSRIDTDAAGARVPEPALGEDPVALLIYDRSGNFAAQFMRRDRSVDIPDGPHGAANNTQAKGGYDAYFGSYTVDDGESSVTQTLLGALSKEHVGAVVTRKMQVAGDDLVIRLDTSAADGRTVTRTLSWRRVG